MLNLDELSSLGGFDTLPITDVGGMEGLLQVGRAGGLLNCMHCILNSTVLYSYVFRGLQAPHRGTGVEISRALADSTTSY